jgi:glucosamine--fructose-6-phosphate aminotransferase (isomerizing)
MYAGMIGKTLIEENANLRVTVEVASEYRYKKVIYDRKTLVILISQSGETADTIAAMRKAKMAGIETLAIVNVVGSTIARESGSQLFIEAGPEIAVATTKAYSAQLIACYLIGIRMASVRCTLDENRIAELLKELEGLPEKIETILNDKERIQWFASKHAADSDMFFIGRGIDYAVSMEGSLKMKEISYIHSEAYPAGELKHGTISLVVDGTLVVGVLTQNALLEKTISNLAECKTRGGYLMAITSYGNYSVEDTADFTVYIPKTDQYFTASLAVIPLQLLGYYLSVAKGLDVDKPRNLAKSVTVE